jgi:hypothetical protein
MRYETGEPTLLILDSPDEVQAVTWAAEDMNRTDLDSPAAQSAYVSAGVLYRADMRRPKSGVEDFTLEGEAADAMVSVLRRWVELGPPKPEGQVTDAARAKSYKTACAIVAKTVELPDSIQ